MKKIPDNAKKVFEGTIFDIYQWEQILKNGTSSLFEAMRRIGSTRVLPVYQNKLVLIEEIGLDGSREILSPGGRLERNELPLEAAKRELFEETGFETSDWEHLFDKDLCDSNKMEWVTSYFIARNCVVSPDEKSDTGENITVKLVEFEEVFNALDTIFTTDPELQKLFLEAKLDKDKKTKLKDLLGITT